jgi:hypothetical protein
MEVDESVQPVTKARLANSWIYEIRYDPSSIYFFDSEHNIRIAIQQNKSKPQKKGAKYIAK